MTGAGSLHVEVLAGSRTGAAGRAPVVLLHSLALDSSVWRRLLEAWPDRAPSVVLVDLPGHGRSAAVGTQSVEAMADEVTRALRPVAAAPASLVGLSLGGCVAQALAVRHPDLVGRLGLVDTTAWYGADAGEAWEQRAATANERGLAALASFQVDRWFSPEFAERERAEVDRLLDVFTRTDPASYTASCRALGAVDLRDAIGRIAAPTVVVVGADDAATPPAHARALAEAIPAARLVVIDDCRHLSPVERPVEVLAALSAVVDSPPSGPLQ